MKKTIALLLAVVMVMAMAACTTVKDPTEPSESETAGATSNESTGVTEGTGETGETEGTEGTVGAEATEGTEGTEGTGEASEGTEGAGESEGTVVDPENIDITNAVETTSAQEPAKLGEWIKSTRYSAASQEYETIYWRVIGTTYDCQEDIDRYNGENHLYEFTKLENEDLAYCKVTYQVYFPAEFSAKEWGISSANLSLYAENPNGGGIEWKGMAYIGLGSCHDITVDQEIMPGDVFTGEAIYVMINDPSVEYVFEYSHNALGADGEMLYDYAAAK